MVKISDQPKSLSTGRGVSSSEAVSKTGGDYDELLSLSEKSAINDIERLLKVAQQTLNSRRDCVCGLLDIADSIAYPREALTRSATGGSRCCCCCCSDCTRQRTELHLPEEEETTPPPAPRHLSNALRTNSAKQHQQQQQQPDAAVVDCHAIAAVGHQKSDARDDDSPSFARTSSSVEPSRTDPVDSPPRRITGGGGGGGESPSLCRGYSNQRRHGRKASLGTTEIRRLIPTLVSENEEFRYKEYRRKSSASAPDDAQNLTL